MRFEPFWAYEKVQSSYKNIFRSIKKIETCIVAVYFVSFDLPKIWSSNKGW